MDIKLFESQIDNLNIDDITKTAIKKLNRICLEDVHGPSIEADIDEKYKANEIIEIAIGNQINIDDIVNLLINDETYRISMYGLREILFDNKWILTQYFNYPDDISDSDVPSLVQCRSIFDDLYRKEDSNTEIFKLLVNKAVDDNPDAINYIWEAYVRL